MVIIIPDLSFNLTCEGMTFKKQNIDPLFKYVRYRRGRVCPAVLYCLPLPSDRVLASLKRKQCG